jgi:hypothetical protein
MKKCSFLFTSQHKKVKESNPIDLVQKKWGLHRQPIYFIRNESDFSIKTIKNVFFKYHLQASSLAIYAGENLN